MQENDLKNFINFMKVIGELYSREIIKSLFSIYWKTLKCYEWEDVKMAFEAHVKSPDGGQFFPRPADIIRRIEGSGETRALEAWTKVDNAIRSIGYYQSVVFDDCLIHAVLNDMGGWMKLCSDSTEENLPFTSREFQKRYMGYVNKKPTSYPRLLMGFIEAENSLHGYAFPSAVLFGDPRKAELVWANGGKLQSGQKVSEFLDESAAKIPIGFINTDMEKVIKSEKNV